MRFSNSQIGESILSIESPSKHIKHFEQSLVNYFVINIQIESLAICACNFLLSKQVNLLVYFIFQFSLLMLSKFLKQLKSIFFFLHMSPSSWSQIKIDKK